MLTCPRCGNDAEYLADEVFSLLQGQGPGVLSL